MRFQPVKCNMMKLTRKRKHYIDYNYKLEGAKLEFLNNIKYLGVNISSDLRWDKHVMECTSKANKGNNKVTELRTILQRESPNS